MTPEEQIKTLETENTKLTAANKALVAENEKLTKAKDALVGETKSLTATRDAQAGEIKTLKKSVDDKDAQLASAGTVVSELKEQLATKAKGTVQLPVVEHGKDTYELVGGSFYYKDQVVSIEVLQVDAKLVAELIGEKVGNLRKIVTA